MWGTYLSVPLPIAGTVGRYPAVCLMGRIPIPCRKPFHAGNMHIPHTSGINPSFEGLSRGKGQVGYALLTRAPVASTALLPPDAPRLACVKPVASVHPEPGSNSSLLYLNNVLFSLDRDVLYPSS